MIRIKVIAKLKDEEIQEFSRNGNKVTLTLLALDPETENYESMNVKAKLLGISSYPAIVSLSAHEEIEVVAGLASWYGEDFHGKLTANGETYDMTALTAAHRTLPFGTKVKVVNLLNNRCVVVRINDRGPFKEERIIDVSKAAAEELDFIRNGIVPVRIEILVKGENGSSICLSKDKIDSNSSLAIADKTSNVVSASKTKILDNKLDCVEEKERGYVLAKNSDSLDKRPDVSLSPEQTTSLDMLQENLGVLHMGHGLNMSLQDILARYKKLQGKEVLWLPGTDHAGIATQNVVERKLKEEGKDRVILGKELFLEEVWSVKDRHHTAIKAQMQRLGLAVDWSRERFTLDVDLCKAVSQAFICLYEKGLIYKGKYLVNWDPSSQSAISDEEVEHKEVTGRLYYLAYPLLEDSSKYLEIATTRPETLFGDVAVAVHPRDKRYKEFIGKNLILPLKGERIPIIADEYVDPNFGTGVVKITPAHDPNDFEMAQRHSLACVNVMNADGTLNEQAGEFEGIDRLIARKKVVAKLKEMNYLLHEETHKHQVGHCHRSGEIIEPYLSEQWFVRMRPLAKRALDALQKGEIRFFPTHWENTYAHWLENIRDWCISRQLWWGHRIPIWYEEQTGEAVASLGDPSTKEEHRGKKFIQEEDTLDTWFSSWLWPFSVMGWPEETCDFKRFYPSSTLVTAYDIIFFWVARMVMAGLEFTEKVPFKDIYITPLIRDKKGRKMSKSLGNGIDPLEVIELYGCDALRFTLAFLSTQGQDLPIDLETFKLGSKFCNKVWNASRFILSRADALSLRDAKKIKFSQLDKWLQASLAFSSKRLEEFMERYRFNEASREVYEFFWVDFCDWYLELQKINFNQAEAAQNKALQEEIYTKLLYFLSESLKLLHPFLPFLSEEIWDKLPNTSGLLLNSSGLKHEDPKEIDVKAWQIMESFKTWISGIRTIRSEFNLSPTRLIDLELYFEEDFSYQTFFLEHLAWAKSLLKANEIRFVKVMDKSKGIAFVGKGFISQALIKEFIDIPQEIARLNKAIHRYEDLWKKTKAKLANQDFLKKAPANIIKEEQEKLKEFERLIKLKREYAQVLQA
ncbi:UNVERIFIED_CONTAM: hypothetical protein PYX00_011052 [Menopon gallinae]|uniref:valine--tRNA ligase n=1 Tax=Menopon gallinae TaxID=328185 RepID=A0AAW2H6Z1_9NEOP